MGCGCGRAADNCGLTRHVRLAPPAKQGENRYATGKGTSSPADFDLRCHPEEAESHAKRATPDEGPALSLPKGPMQLAAC